MSRIADALSKSRHSRHVRDIAPLPQAPWDFTESESEPIAPEPAVAGPVPVTVSSLAESAAPAAAPRPVVAPASARTPSLRPVTDAAPKPQTPDRAPSNPDAADTVVRRIESDERYASRLLGAPDLPSPIVEQYRALAAAVVQNARIEGTRVLMVTSALPGEGKTLVASNLALTLSGSYRSKVLLVDVDLRRPCIHSVFGLPPAPGVSEWIASSAPPEEAAPVAKVSEHLSVMVAGAPRKDPMSIVAGPTMQSWVKSCESQYDWIILDTPPVGLLADAGLLAALAHKVVLVVQAGRTPYDVIQKATEAVGQERILGVVLNQVDEAVTDTYKYHYSSYYSGTS